MAAVIFGIVTALLWSVSNLCSARSVRHIGQYSVVAWAMLVGLVITTPWVVLSGVPAGLDAATLWGLAGIGAAVVGGLLLLYAALSVGKVGIVAPIAATEGAVAAVLSAVFGESIAAVVVLLLVVIVAGVVLSAVGRDPAPVAHERPVRAALLATASAVSFGLGLFLTGRLAGDLPLIWVVYPPRVVGTLAIFVPLLLTRRLRLTRAALPLVVATGFSEVLAYLAFGLGSRTSLAVVAVLASQVSTFTVLGGRVLFGERLGRVQVLGVVMVISCITLLALITST